MKVLPEWQHLKVRDTVPIWRNLDFPVVALGKRIDIWFLRARINTTAWRWGGTLSTEATWVPYNWASPLILAQLFADLADFVAVRQNLRGIKARAEGRRPERQRTVYAELVLWVACFVVFLASEIALLVRGLLRPLLGPGR